MAFEQLAALKEQLTKQAAAEKEARKRQAEKNNRPPVDPVVRNIGLLQKQFPLAFPKKPLAKIPLKIGIHNDLLEHIEQLGLSANDIRAALKKWCQGKRYSECMVAGAARVDLQGHEVGFVTKEEATFADNSRPQLQKSAPA
ncbi:ProQ/FinO family protein [Methylomonas sp. MED-D]|uniref:ProQ/FinO family protein n=1 Tax=unclassified Methylomonas TaxID=2608980 RepID=UPI0028A4E845|nr:ProQ/FinO family protein [Methylomonas sp. MV1]MDT4330816.1 ProQ/FinO family protein [Methylomonas sp. MV1]